MKNKLKLHSQTYLLSSKKQYHHKAKNLIIIFQPQPDNKRIVTCELNYYLVYKQQP